MIENFQINSKQPISKLFLSKGIKDFEAACAFIKHLPVGRNTSRTDFESVFSDHKGTCSTKHGLLATLALENQQDEIELMFCIYLLSKETHPHLESFFSKKKYSMYPETHCFLRYKGKRYDFTYPINFIESIETKIVREQRIDPNQVGEWKMKIHEDYIVRWLQRKPEITSSFLEIWRERESFQK